jgi:hypothetical protein
MQVQEKLVQACRGLGLNLLEIAQFVQVSDEPVVACWGYDTTKGENYIYINPLVLKLPADHVRLILRHEILHYAGYKNLQHARDFLKANLAFDVVINKILTMAYEPVMKALCRRIYASGSLHTVIALARPDVNPGELRTYRALWKEIWNNPEVPSPASVYYRITKPVKAGNNPFAAVVVVNSHVLYRQIPDCHKDRAFDKLAENAVEQVRNDVKNKGFSTTRLDEAFHQVFVRKTSFDCESIEDFISRISSRQTIEDACNRIIAALTTSSMCQLYPYQLSRLGMVYLVCGVSDKVPIFWNRLPESGRSRLAVYIDTSPSMDGYQDREVFVIDRLRGYFPTQVFCFAHSVKEISLDDFAEGGYEEGYSTSFDAVVEHLVQSTYDAGIIFTDGDSDVNPENRECFRQSRKRLFAVYFSSNGEISSELDGLCEQTMTVKVR